MQIQRSAGTDMWLSGAVDFLSVSFYYSHLLANTDLSKFDGSADWTYIENDQSILNKALHSLSLIDEANKFLEVQINNVICKYIIEKDFNYSENDIKDLTQNILKDVIADEKNTFGLAARDYCLELSIALAERDEAKSEWIA